LIHQELKEVFSSSSLKSSNFLNSFDSQIGLGIPPLDPDKISE